MEGIISCQGAIDSEFLCMSLKKLISGFALASLLALGVGAGLSATKGNVAHEAKATNPKRLNILINNGSWWKNDSAKIGLTYNDATHDTDGKSGTPMWITADSDFGTVENGFSWITIGSTGYGLLSMVTDFDLLTGSGYNNIGIRRRNPSDGGDWGNDWTLTPSYFSTSNTIVINASSGVETGTHNYWKVTTYSGASSYADLSKATKSVYLRANGSYTPENPGKLSDGSEFAGWYTDASLTLAWGGTLSAETTLYAKYNSASVDIYKGGALQGESFSYNSAQHQWEGIVSFAVADSFVIRKTVNAVTTDYGYDELEDSPDAELYPNAKSQGKVTDGDNNIVIAAASAGAYSIYVKDSGFVWMQSASASDEAYMYGAYFLANVGCNYPDVPTGWSVVKERYAKVSDPARTIIAGKTADEHGDEIEEMLFVYSMALTNHSSLRTAANNFLVDGSGDPIIASRIVAPVSLETTNNASNTTLIVIITVSAVALIGVGAYFYLRKRKED